MCVYIFFFHASSSTLLFLVKLFIYVTPPPPKEFPNKRPFNRVWLVAGTASRGVSRGTVTLSSTRKSKIKNFASLTCLFLAVARTRRRAVSRVRRVNPVDFRTRKPYSFWRLSKNARGPPMCIAVVSIGHDWLFFFTFPFEN